MELLKGKGLKSFMKSYRGIMLSDMDGKCFGSFIRAGVFIAVAALGGVSHNGAGLNAAPTDLCSLQVTQVFPVAKMEKLTGGIVFVDLVSAFANVSRRIVIPDMLESEE